MVVVAEADLVDLDRVVFVDDGHGVPREQLQQRVADIQIAGAVIEVLGGEQDLRGVGTVRLQISVVGANEMALADGGCRLQLGKRSGSAMLAEPTQSSPDGP